MEMKDNKKVRCRLSQRRRGGRREPRPEEAQRSTEVSSEENQQLYGVVSHVIAT
jgi:hypothetical protein